MTTTSTGTEVDSAYILQAGRRLKVLSIATGERHSKLQAAAERHATYQARLGVQGHQHWDQRFRALAAAMPECSGFREICAESWPGQSVAAAAEEMFNSWKQSPGHWTTANGSCTFWGYAMAYGGRKRTWYACGVLADLRA